MNSIPESTWQQIAQERQYAVTELQTQVDGYKEAIDRLECEITQLKLENEGLRSFAERRKKQAAEIELLRSRNSKQAELISSLCEQLAIAINPRYIDANQGGGVITFDDAEKVTRA